VVDEGKKQQAAVKLLFQQPGINGTPQIKKPVA